MADQFDREDVEAVADCLGDDAAQLRQANDEDERADNMDRAASMLTWMLLTHPAYACGVLPSLTLDQQPQVRALMARAFEEGADAMEHAAIEAVREHSENVLEASRVLAEFAKTAPGRLPSHVQEALAVVDGVAPVEAPSLPRSDSKDAIVGIEAVLAERNYPTSSNAAGRAGWEAAFRWLRTHGVQPSGGWQPE